mmetsp:Transcript_13452/g.22945  ORF Transcript_13452/g.22945 Transcript_13452/m.22945 type:complete len:278 (+) Transcript_13452:60-893(+)
MKILKSMTEAMLRLARSRANALLEEASLQAIFDLVKKLDHIELNVHENDYYDTSDPNNAYVVTQGQRELGIQYIDVGECEYFTMCVFVLPPAHRIPLHDHPHMSVFSKVLWGEMEIESYDLVRTMPLSPKSKPSTNGNSPLPQSKMPTLSRDRIGNSNMNNINSVLFQKPTKVEALVRPRDVDIVRSGEVRMLRQFDGNVHSFMARKWTAVFDLVIPPYNTDEGRPCHYYPSPRYEMKLDPQELSKRDQTLRLTETDCPRWYFTTRREYEGSNPGLP